MVPRRRMLIAILTVAASVAVGPLVPPARAAAGDLPSRLSDKAFWQLVSDLSEAGGSFRSDNFLSNERGYQVVIPELIASAAKLEPYSLKLIGQLLDGLDVQLRAERLI